MPKEKFIPALGFSSLNNLYDRFALWAFRKTSFHKIIQEVIKVVASQKGEHILDLGCGPGQLAIRFKKKNPQCHISAVDRDPEILSLAEKNAQKASITVKFIQQDLARLNLPEKFNCVYSTFVFHHLPIEAKRQALDRLRKVLKPGGRFILADFCKAETWWERLTFLPVQWIDGFETTTPHIQGWLESELGKHFSEVEKKTKISTFLGPVSVFVCTANS